MQKSDTNNNLRKQVEVKKESIKEENSLEQEQHFGYKQPIAGKTIPTIPTTTTSSLIPVASINSGTQLSEILTTSSKPLITFKCDTTRAHQHHLDKASLNNNKSNKINQNKYNNSQRPQQHLTFALAAKNSLESLASTSSLNNTTTNNTTTDVDSSASSTPQPQLLADPATDGNQSRHSSLASLRSNKLPPAKGQQHSLASTKFVSPPRIPSIKKNSKPQDEENGALSFGANGLSLIETSNQVHLKSIKRLEGKNTGNRQRKHHDGNDNDDDDDEPQPRQFDSRISVVVPPKSARVEPPFMAAGILASALGSVFFSASIACVKLLPDGEALSEKAKAMFFRGFFIMILCTATMIYQKSSVIVPRGEFWINTFRCIFGAFGVFGSYCSLNYISTGDSTALIFSSPIWTSIMGHFIFKEPLRWIQLVALPGSLFGIVMIAHPSLIFNVDFDSGKNLTSSVTLMDSREIISTNTSELFLSGLNASTIKDPTGGLDTIHHHEHEPFDFKHRWPGIAISLGTSLLVSCNYICLKHRKLTPIQTTTFWFGFSQVAMSLVIMLSLGFGQLPDTLYEWSLLVAIGFFSWIAQSCLQWAFTHEEVGVLSIVRTLDVALTFVMSAIFLSESIYWTSVLGASIIGLVVVCVMLSGFAGKRKANSTSEKDTANHLSLNKELYEDAMKYVDASSQKGPYIISKA